MCHLVVPHVLALYVDVDVDVVDESEFPAHNLATSGPFLVAIFTRYLLAIDFTFTRCPNSLIPWLKLARARLSERKGKVSDQQMGKWLM